MNPSTRPSKGVLGSPLTGIILGIIYLCLFLKFSLQYPVLLWCVGGILVLGAGMAFLLPWYYRTHPIKLDDTEARSVLGLDDEKPIRHDHDEVQHDAHNAMQGEDDSEKKN